jgi:pyrophosphate--fructose-6-phosphate 1-phosphotransferase
VHAVTFDHVCDDAGKRTYLDARRARVCEETREVTLREPRFGLLADRRQRRRRVGISETRATFRAGGVPIRVNNDVSLARRRCSLRPLHAHTPARVFGDIAASPRPPAMSMEDLSPLQRARLAYEPVLPECLAAETVFFRYAVQEASGDAGTRTGGSTPGEVSTDEPAPTPAEHRRRASDDVGDRGGRRIVLADHHVFPETSDTPTFHLSPEVRALAPAERVRPVPARRGVRLGLLFSGGPAPGGHNVAAGMFDCLSRRFPDDFALVGFLGGPAGLVEKRWTPLDAAAIAPHRNQGGFHLLSSGRLRLDTEAHFRAAARTCADLRLDGVVVVGGDDSNTNAAYLAEHFAADGIRTAVVGVPKTIDNDCCGEDVRVCFGFDTAARTYAEIVGNLCQDARSTRIYYHFVRIMGRRAGHLTLEVANRTRPNMALIGEEIAAKGMSLSDVVDEVATLVAARADLGLNHGVVLVPEGLLSFVPEMAELMEETAAAATTATTFSFADVRESISPSASRAAAGIPNDILDEMLASRDAHGNPALSAVETEKLLARLVARKLSGVLTERGRVAGRFSAKMHFCGYEGRSGLPTNFDATYAYALGHAAATLAAGGANGVVAAIPNPTDPPARWRVVGAPLCRMLRAERRAGKDRLVIRKTLVDLEGGAFRAFAAERDAWRLGDRYSCPGPTQFASDETEPPLALTLTEGEKKGGGGGRCRVAGDDEKMVVERSASDAGAWAA